MLHILVVPGGIEKENEENREESLLNTMNSDVHNLANKNITTFQIHDITRCYHLLKELSEGIPYHRAYSNLHVVMRVNLADFAFQIWSPAMWHCDNVKWTSVNMSMSVFSCPSPSLSICRYLSSSLAGTISATLGTKCDLLNKHAVFAGSNNWNLTAN